MKANKYNENGEEAAKAINNESMKIQ